jgi:hypothetical protein
MCACFQSFYQTLLASGTIQRGIEQWGATSQVLEQCQGSLNSIPASVAG